MDVHRVVIGATYLLISGAGSLGAQVGTPPPGPPPGLLSARLTHTLLEASGFSHGLSSLALEKVDRLGWSGAMEGADEATCAEDQSLYEEEQRVPCVLFAATQRYLGFSERLQGGAFLPVRNHFDAISFWKEGDGTPEVLRTGSLLLEDDFVATDLEILSDLIGSFRVGLGVTVVSQRGDEADSTLVTPPEDEPVDDLGALSRLANTGGTVHLAGSFPVFYRAPEGQRSVLAAMLVTRVATESPAVGGYLENPALSGSVGLELTYYRPGFEEMIDLEVGAIARTYSFNKAFREKIGTEHDGAGLVALKAGIVIARRTMLALTWRLYSSPLFAQQSNLIVSLQTVRR